MELETQLLLAERLGFSRSKEVGQILDTSTRISKMLTALIRKIQ